MACSICSWSSDHPVYLLLHETKFWRIVLAPNQVLVGRCLLHLKRHCGDLAEVSPDEILEWLIVVKRLEIALRTAFDTTMFNWSRYMNHSYRDDPPEPHIHWWAVPRYDHQIRIDNWLFEDKEFGNPYDHYHSVEVPRELHNQIAEIIRQAFAQTLPTG